MSVLGGNLSELGSEFQRTLPKYTRLDLKRSILGISILSFSECREWFSGKISHKRGNRGGGGEGGGVSSTTVKFLIP